MLKWTTTDAAVQNGINVCVYSEAGMGKTTLCATAPAPLVLSAEGGLLALRKVKIPAIEIATVDDLSEAYEFCRGSQHARHFQTICLDSISEMAEVILVNAKKTVRDPRQAYGELLEKMMMLIRAFRDLTQFNIYMAAKMEPMKDEMAGTIKYVPSMPGTKLTPQIPYLFDEVFALRMNKTPQGQSYRYLQTAPDLQYTAKDRSGALDLMEEPNLSKIFDKIRSNK